MEAERYTLRSLPRVEKHLRAIAQQDVPRVLEAIEGLAANPRPRGCRKLTAREGYRIRVGRLRLLYLIADDERVVTVTDVRPRSDAYR